MSGKEMATGIEKASDVIYHYFTIPSMFGCTVLFMRSNADLIISQCYRESQIIDVMPEGTYPTIRKKALATGDRMGTVVPSPARTTRPWTHT